MATTVKYMENSTTIDDLKMGYSDINASVLEESTTSFMTGNTTAAIDVASEDSSNPVVGALITVGFLSVGLFICVGNLLVILAIRRTPELQNNTNTFVTHLAVADFLIGFQVIIVRSIYEFRVIWLDTYFICYTRFFVRFILTFASGYFLCGE